MTDFLIGRQQIFDKDLNICAYEILFRGQDFDLNEQNQATLATNQVITDTILELGINKLVDHHKAFINFTNQNILEKTPLNLPKERIVIEVLEDVIVDLRIINNLRELSQLGYTIALDDFVYSEEWEPLIEIADIIKLDVLAMTDQQTIDLISKLKPYNLKLLAEKVETQKQFNQLRDLGCEFFQGFFLSKPNIVEGRRIGVNQTAAIRLLGVINKPDIEIPELIQVISEDVGLSYKLLHYINSAFFSLSRKIESISQAVVYLGISEIKRWSNILTLASLTNKPKAVIQTALIRGKMCELLALQLERPSEHFFLLGMLSSLDSILDIPLDYALDQLPLTPDIPNAILKKEGFAGELLDYVLNYEQWPPISNSFSNLAPDIINNAYIESIDWTKNLLSNVT